VPVINLTVLQDVLGSTEPVDAVITATVNRASVDAYRINNQFVIFPRDIKIKVVAGEPEVDFVLTALPTSYYWHIDIFVNGEAPVRRTVIVPSGNGPFDFDELAAKLKESRRLERERCAQTVERLISGDGICADDGVWIHDCVEAIRELEDV